ncbi:MAG: Rieske family iron-sulfur cluster-binding protein [bacterium]|nr:Rieske family iron-sulfur cluster-binding protein [bacterium]
MDRRKFLKTTAAGGAIITIGVVPPGCGNPVAPAPLARVLTQATPDLPTTIKQAVVFDNALGHGDAYGTVQLLVDFYPQLVPQGGAITLELGKEITASNSRGYSVPIDNTILLVHAKGPRTDQFLALQSSCPHAACPLGFNADADMIECPCHASRFAADPDKTGKEAPGAVTHPPANQALQRWQATAATTASGVIVTVDLKVTVSDCATLPAVVKSASGTTLTLTLPLAQFPELTAAGGTVCGQPSGLGNPIIVTRLDAATVIAVDSRCTHLGCTVNWNGVNRDFECPCHGSTFASDGRVQVGPATVPLKSYSVTVDADSVVVTIPAA